MMGDGCALMDLWRVLGQPRPVRPVTSGHAPLREPFAYPERVARQPAAMLRPPVGPPAVPSKEPKEEPATSRSPSPMPSSVRPSSPTVFRDAKLVDRIGPPTTWQGPKVQRPAAPSVAVGLPADASSCSTLPVRPWPPVPRPAAIPSWRPEAEAAANAASRDASPAAMDAVPASVPGDRAVLREHPEGQVASGPPGGGHPRSEREESRPPPLPPSPFVPLSTAVDTCRWAGASRAGVSLSPNTSEDASPREGSGGSRTVRPFPRVPFRS